MNYTLDEIMDMPTVQSLLDSLDEINKLPSAILDPEGRILTATSWQDICTKFHRKNHDSANKCRESDTRIEINIGESASPVVYRCPMGLTDAAAPIIVEGQHLGNVFIGQLFMEQPDMAYFSEQARRYGFDENSYLEAVRKAPICSEESLRINLDFIRNFVQALAEKGLQNKRQLESERKLLESEKKLQVIFDTSEAGIVVVSPLGIITFANRRMADMFCLPLEELIGTHYIDYVHEADKQAGIKYMKQISQGEKTSIELIRHYIRKDGTDFWGNLTGTRFENVDGSMRDQIIVISDISERKRAEDEKMLLEQQLQQAQKLESLGVLAGGIAHDFNNILAIIMGNVYLAKTEPESAEGPLANIEKAVERAAGLCQQMMTYAGNAPFDLSKINLMLLVEEMVTLLRTTIPQNAALEFLGKEDVPCILGDANQVSQIAMNLVINASEAIGIEQGEIKVDLTKVEIKPDEPITDYHGNKIEPNQYVCLEVSDNGEGMDEETLKRIFEPFYTTKFMGRGLGMSAVLGIVSKHKASLQIESQAGKGTSFRIFFPVQSEELNVVATQTQAPIEKLNLSTHTILLVEDEDEVRSLLCKMINKLGFSTIEASNGIDALKVYGEHAASIKLVMTDIGMPFMDGHELIQRLKSLNRSLPIIVSSGFSQQTITARTPRDDIAYFVSKPYKLDQLRDVLRCIVEDTPA